MTYHFVWEHFILLNLSKTHIFQEHSTNFVCFSPPYNSRVFHTLLLYHILRFAYLKSSDSHKRLFFPQKIFLFNYHHQYHTQHIRDINWWSNKCYSVTKWNKNYSIVSHNASSSTWIKILCSRKKCLIMRWPSVILPNHSKYGPFNTQDKLDSEQRMLFSRETLRLWALVPK